MIKNEFSHLSHKDNLKCDYLIELVLRFKLPHSLVRKFDGIIWVVKGQTFFFRWTTKTMIRLFDA